MPSSEVTSLGDATMTAGFSLTNPSTWAFVMPDWQGDVNLVAAKISGEVQGVENTVITGFEGVESAVIDPVVKAKDYTENEAAALLSSGEQKISAVGESLSSGVKSAFNFVAEPIQLAIFAVVGLTLVYFALPLIAARR